jgi:hypothetical protein
MKTTKGCEYSPCTIQQYGLVINGLRSKLMYLSRDQYDKSEEPFRCSTLGAHGLTRKYYTKQERLAKNNH